MPYLTCLKCRFERSPVDGSSSTGILDLKSKRDRMIAWLCRLSSQSSRNKEKDSQRQKYKLL